MANKAGIQINIVGQVDAQSFKKAEQEIAKLGAAANKAGQTGAKGLNELKKPLDSLKASASQLMGSFGVGGGLATGAFSALKTAFADIKAETGSFNSLLWASGQTLATVGAIGVGAVVGLTLVAKKAADAFASWGAEVKTVQQRTGASAEDASRLAVVLDHLGIDTELAAKSFQIFGRNVTTGAAPLREFFSASEIAQFRVGDLIGSLPALQAKFQALGTAQEKSAFVMAAFGRGGASLRPLLSLTADETKRLAKESDDLGLTLTQTGINAATEYKRSLNDLHAAFRGLAVQAGQKVIPDLTAGVQSIVNVVKAVNKLDESFANFYERNKHNPLGFILRSFDVGHVLDQTKSLAGARQTDADAAEAETSALDNLQSATLGLYNANRSLSRAATGVAEAQYALSTAQRNLSKLQAQGAVDAQKVADAHKDVERAARGVEQANRGVYDSDRQLVESHRGVERAERSLTSAQEAQSDSVRGLADAQQALVDAQQKLQDVAAGPKPLDLAEAQLRAEEAATGLQRADQRLSQAALNLTKTQKDNASTGLDVLDAQLSLTEAGQAYRGAAIAQQRAQEDLNEITHQGEEGSKDYTDALKGVQDASRAVEAASRQQRDATQAVTDAQYALVESSGAVEQAEYGHQQALLAVRDASDAVTEAGRKLREAEAGDPDFADRLRDARHGVAAAERSLTDARLDAGAAALARADAEEKEADALALAGGNTKVLLDRLSTLRSQFPQYAAFFDQIVKLLGVAVGTISLTGIGGGNFGGGGGSGGARGSVAVPGFQEGGTVPGPLGRPMLAVVHGGETVTKAGASSSTTINLNVYGSLVHQSDLGELLNRALMDFQRRGG